MMINLQIKDINVSHFIKPQDIFWFIFILSVITRLFYLGSIPLGINQDEAFAAYEAFSILNYGTDSWGYRFPVYFISWGGGMNVLYSYVMIPFIKILGTSIFVIRLPQSLFGIISCYVFYRLLKIIYTREIALLGYFLITIVPWHIILSRFGLESNLVVSFILLGFYFYVRAFKNNKYLILSSLFYGLAFYCYAASWIFLVVTILLQYVYFIYFKHSKKDILYLILSAFLLSILVFPLFLLILVNSGIIEEIRTSFISIPKLLHWRGNELGYNNLEIKLKALYRVLILQNDFLITNNLQPYGIYYIISIPFILLGIYKLYQNTRADIKSKKYSFNFLILAHIIIGLLYAAALFVCINRINYIFLSLIIALTLGIIALKRYRYVFIITIFIYSIHFIAFCDDYIHLYNAIAQYSFTPKFGDAVEWANSNRIHNQKIIVSANVPFTKALWYSKLPTPEYINTVQWKVFPVAYLEAQSFGHYIFDKDINYADINTDFIYIAPADKKYFFYEFNLKQFGNFIVAIPKNNKKPAYE